MTSASVVIQGVGGIGSWLAEGLARCGIGKITIIDPDIVELTNLSRQAFFTEADLGRSKTEVVREKILAINSEIKVQTIRQMITCASELTPIIDGSTLVANCSDNPDISITNDIVSEACFTLRMPHMLCGGYDGHLSYVGQTVIPYKTACWKCYSEGGTYERSLRGFEHIPITDIAIKGGTLAPIASITANIHTLEAVRLISGYSKPLMANYKAELDFLSFTLHKTRIRRKTTCSLCGVFEGSQK